MVDTQYLIDVNRLILERWNKRNPKNQQHIGARHPEIDGIIPMVEKYDKNNMKLEDLIQKASYLMAIISWSQPFLDGNKRTGIISATKFLYDNGFDLDIKKKDESEIRNLLYDIQDNRTNLDDSIVAKIIIYTTKRIKKHESR